jgi:hypothetical protein
VRARFCSGVANPANTALAVKKNKRKREIGAARGLPSANFTFVIGPPVIGAALARRRSHRGRSEKIIPQM